MFRVGKTKGSSGHGHGERMLALLTGALTTAGAEVAAGLAAATGPDLSAGRGAVAADIHSIFAGPWAVAGILAGEKAGKTSAWIGAIKAGESPARLRRILRGTSLAGIEVLSEPDAALHRQFLRGSRRQPGRPLAIVSRHDRLQQFIRANQARVGTARKGWQDAAADLGGGGAAAAAAGSRRKCGRGTVTVSGTGVRVEVTNLVPYARHLSEPGERAAVVAAAGARAAAKLKGGAA
jgi:hypothetical protein